VAVLSLFNYTFRIKDPSQPLLRISNALARHDLRNPVVRPSTYLGSVKSREDFLKEKTLLVPELVRIHPIPAQVWRECQIAPFVVHTVQKLLRAAELARAAAKGVELDAPAEQKSGSLNFSFIPKRDLFTALVR
jgi:hypothetical protein